MRKPVILVVGGEKKNFKSGRLQERMDVFLHLKEDGDRIKAQSGKKFDAVVGLPWITPTLSKNAKAWAKASGILHIETPSVGQIEYWLSKRFPWADRYFKELDRPLVKKVDVKIQEPGTPAASPVSAVPAVEAEKWDEDQLWDAYGESFVSSIKGLDGETTDRKTFVELLEGETGLKGEPVEILMSILRRQGIVSQQGEVIAIGSVNPIDIEKRKKFIEREGRKIERSRGKAFDNGSRSISNEVREAFIDEVEAPLPEVSSQNKPRLKVSPPGRFSSAFTDDELLGFVRKLDPCKIYQNVRALYDDLGRVGLGPSPGKCFSYWWMKLYMDYMAKLGVSREQTGERWSLRLVVRTPGEAKAVLLPEAMPDVYSPAPAPAKPVQPAPSVQPQAAQSQVTVLPPVPAKEADITKPAVLYELVLGSYPKRKIPDLVALVEPVRALRGIFFESQWARASARGILQRVGMPLNDPNIMRVIQRRLDFTDDEWSYFAIEYLRDQTLISLLPMIVNTNVIWRHCPECQETFSVNLPSICYACRDFQRKVVQSAKGDS